MTPQAPTGARSEPQASEAAVLASSARSRPRKWQASEAVVLASSARSRPHN